MNERVIQISGFISAPAADEGDYTIYTTNPGVVTRLKTIQVSFPEGTRGELELYLKYGHVKISPQTPCWKGDGTRIDDLIDFEFGGGVDIVIHYKNLSTTDTRYATIKIEACVK